MKQRGLGVVLLYGHLPTAAGAQLCLLLHGPNSLCRAQFSPLSSTKLCCSWRRKRKENLSPWPVKGTGDWTGALPIPEPGGGDAGQGEDRSPAQGTSETEPALRTPSVPCLSATLPPRQWGMELLGEVDPTRSPIWAVGMSKVRTQSCYCHHGHSASRGPAHLAQKSLQPSAGLASDLNPQGGDTPSLCLQLAGSQLLSSKARAGPAQSPRGPSGGAVRVEKQAWALGSLGETPPQPQSCLPLTLSPVCAHPGLGPWAPTMKPMLSEP